MLGFSADAQDLPAQRARMVSEVQAMYAETQRETGFAAMSNEVARALGKVERHRLVPPGVSMPGIDTFSTTVRSPFRRSSWSTMISLLSAFPT